MHIKGGDKPPQGSQMAPEQAYHGCIIKSGYSEIGRPPFIPMKAAQWCMKPKCLDFPGLKTPRSEDVFQHHWAPRVSTLETLLLRRLLPVSHSAS